MQAHPAHTTHVSKSPARVDLHQSVLQPLQQMLPQLPAEKVDLRGRSSKLDSRSSASMGLLHLNPGYPGAQRLVVSHSGALLQEAFAPHGFVAESKIVTDFVIGFEPALDILLAHKLKKKTAAVAESGREFEGESEFGGLHVRDQGEHQYCEMFEFDLRTAGY